MGEALSVASMSFTMVWNSSPRLVQSRAYKCPEAVDGKEC